MWSNLPLDLLATIFSYLSPDSLAKAKSTCRNWHAAAESTTNLHRHPPWFVVLPTLGLSCYAHNPIGQKWHVLPIPLDHTLRPIATIHGLILAKFTNTTSLKLAITNPFTRQFKSLPELNLARTNPAVGLVDHHHHHHHHMSITQTRFKIYVAGGMSEGGATYQPTVEAYDPSHHTWTIIGRMPVEFAVRLTVWTPNESVYSNGTLYWMTSARAYSVMGFEIATNRWKELSVPMADRLEFAALVPIRGRLGVVGGTCSQRRWSCSIWELIGEDEREWRVAGNVPFELGARLLGDNASVKCVGVNGAICLYRDTGSRAIIWRDSSYCEWIEGRYCSVGAGGSPINNVPIKAFLLHPNLAHSAFSSVFV